MCTKQILVWLDDHREQLLDFTARLIATPSPNLPGDERAVVEVILAQLQDLGEGGADPVGREIAHEGDEDLEARGVDEGRVEASLDLRCRGVFGDRCHVRAGPGRRS